MRILQERVEEEEWMRMCWGGGKVAPVRSGEGWVKSRPGYL